ncbi:TetR family transcriptional regulator C-terminal domain-containing protein [Gottfriedia acidiceleris]|uniref:TetR family transcriptional regulator C-terminal domain-containing protein n=1 Tax=Gottfriedia acidiceleris TaxID=371036 RepID=UPI00101D08A7|nr:hypothetical protein [Gottfriedia acidiceleris]
MFIKAVELTLHNEEVAEKIEQNFSKTEKIIYKLLLSGQKSGEIPKHYDFEKLSQFIHNAFIGLRVLVKTTNDKNKLKNIIDTTLCIRLKINVSSHSII